jgi:hypothetical protein
MCRVVVTEVVRQAAAVVAVDSAVAATVMVRTNDHPHGSVDDIIVMPDKPLVFLMAQTGTPVFVAVIKTVEAIV